MESKCIFLGIGKEKERKKLIFTAYPKLNPWRLEQVLVFLVQHATCYSLVTRGVEVAGDQGQALRRILRAFKPVW